jgi:para-nitrobenzyl esterase
MASPMARDVVAKAIGESGAFFGRTLHAKPLAETEQDGAKFAQQIGAASLAKLRAIPAQQLLDDVMKDNSFRFGPNIDGYFLPASPAEIYAKGEQAHVPLLAGWNHDEGSWRQFFGKQEPTRDNYIADVRKNFGDHADEILKLFPANTDQEIKQSAGLLSTADFIAYGTWKWIEMQKQTGGSAVYRYEFDQAPPAAEDATDPLAGKVAYHSAEIEYVFGTLDSKKLPWRAEDYRLSDLMGTYWTNFAKTGDPNSKGLPEWPQYRDQNGLEVMHLVASQAREDQHHDQYEAIDKASATSTTPGK